MPVGLLHGGRGDRTCDIPHVDPVLGLVE
jgi:hypothetical protein